MNNLPGNALLALASATSWGGGDFSGGMGVKAAGGSTAGALRVVTLAYAVSLAVLVVVLFAAGHAVMPHGALLAWGLSAGIAAGFALAAFYMALARGAMGSSAAISGVLAAGIPAVVSSFLEGKPGALRLAGFALALAAIWIIAAGPSPENVGDGRATMGLAIFGGVGFGFYFVALRMDNALGMIEPMVLSRVGSLVTSALLLVLFTLRARRFGTQERGPWLSRTAVLWSMGVALLDSGGNLLFLAASRGGRLDIASVLAGLYPAVTILLAAWQLHEKPTRRQVAGMVLALVAVVMITA